MLFGIQDGLWCLWRLNDIVLGTFNTIWICSLVQDKFRSTSPPITLWQEAIVSANITKEIEIVRVKEKKTVKKNPLIIELKNHFTFFLIYSSFFLLLFPPNNVITLFEVSLKRKMKKNLSDADKWNIILFFSLHPFHSSSLKIETHLQLTIILFSSNTPLSHLFLCKYYKIISISQAHALYII